jgi:GR25 family glycosyltransferase involved in LPS biosynthesis
MVHKAHKALKGFDEFETPTIKISDNVDLYKFCKDNKDFHFDPNGYSLHNEQGWRYGELGIWASNWLAWNNFANSDYDYLVLMEDDLACQENLGEYIVKYINECPEDFDALYIFSPADQWLKHDPSKDVSKNITRAYQDWSCACYVIQKKTIQDMISVANGGFNLPLDWFMFRQQNLFNIYSVAPNAYQGCKTESVESTFQTKQNRGIIYGIF